MKPGGKGAGVEKGGEETSQGSPESNKNMMAPFLFGTKGQQEDYLSMASGKEYTHAHMHTADHTRDPN